MMVTRERGLLVGGFRGSTPPGVWTLSTSLWIYSSKNTDEHKGVSPTSGRSSSIRVGSARLFCEERLSLGSPLELESPSPPLPEPESEGDSFDSRSRCRRENSMVDLRMIACTHGEGMSVLRGVCTPQVRVHRRAHAPRMQVSPRGRRGAQRGQRVARGERQHVRTRILRYWS